MTTTPRPWVSLACMTGRPDDCNLVHGDGRRCANPAHDAYPDDLQPAGEQPTLDAPVLNLPPSVRAAVDRLDAEPSILERLADLPPSTGPVPYAVEDPNPSRRRRRWTCDRCGELVIRAEHVGGTRKDPVYACDQVPGQTHPGGPFDTTQADLDREAADPPSPAELIAGKAADMVDAFNKTFADAIAAAPPTDEPPWHNHAWDRLEDPHNLYVGKAYVCGCGSTMDDRRVYPFGEIPAAVVLPDVGDGNPHDALAGMAVVVEVDGRRITGELAETRVVDPADLYADEVGDLVRRVADRADAALAARVVRALRTHGWVIHHEGVGPVELTGPEVKRITAAHMVLRPEQAIITERRRHPGGAP